MPTYPAVAPVSAEQTTEDAQTFVPSDRWEEAAGKGATGGSKRFTLHPARHSKGTSRFFGHLWKSQENEGVTPAEGPERGYSEAGLRERLSPPVASESDKSSASCPPGSKCWTEGPWASALKSDENGDRTNVIAGKKMPGPSSSSSDSASPSPSSSRNDYKATTTSSSKHQTKPSQSFQLPPPQPGFHGKKPGHRMPGVFPSSRPSAAHIARMRQLETEAFYR